MSMRQASEEGWICGVFKMVKLQYGNEPVVDTNFLRIPRPFLLSLSNLDI